MMPVDNDQQAAAPAASNQLLEQVFAARAVQEQAAAPSTCPSCSAKLSGVELKFERCLSCGKTFGSTNVAVSVGL
jgi:hypothetical protein